MERVLPTPVLAVESERCFNTIRRVKICLRNFTGQGRLNDRAVLNVYEDVTADTPTFNQKVIELFQSQKILTALK